MAQAWRDDDYSVVNTQNISTAPAIEPRREGERRRKQNVVQLPKRELQKNARHKIHALRAVGYVITFMVIFLTITSVVFAQVQLTELTTEISKGQKMLEEEQSLNVQLQMKAGRGISAAEVEKYATTVLGMTKIGESQISFLSIDKNRGGVIVEEQTSGFIKEALATIKAWFS